VSTFEGELPTGIEERETAAAQAAEIEAAERAAAQAAAAAHQEAVLVDLPAALAHPKVLPARTATLLLLR